MKSFTPVASPPVTRPTLNSLVDTNVLVYRHDPRDQDKQRRATELIESGIGSQSLCIAHQSVLEFVSVLSRPRKSLGDRPLLSLSDALLEAESLMRQLTVLFPSRAVVHTAMRGTTLYGLPWFDAQIWAIAEVHGLDQILSEDFQHGRHYGAVRVVNPFVQGLGVQELPAMYATRPVRIDSPGADP